MAHGVVSRLAAARRRYAGRRVPHGLFGPGLLLCHRPLVRTHLRLWWAGRSGVPPAAHVVLELWLYVRFLLTLPRQLRQAPRGRRVRLLVRSAAWSVPPGQLLLFGLDRPGSRLLEFVFDQEIGGWHALRNRDASATALLADKQAFAELAAAHGVTVPRALVAVRRGSAEPLATLLTGTAGDPLEVFCKLRAGNRALGAFAAVRAEAGWIGRRLNGPPLDSPAAVESAWRELIGHGDALVQPLLRDCVALRPLAEVEGDEVTTIRAITRRDDELLVALLEVPLPTGGYAILEIEAATGAVLPEVPHHPTPAAARAVRQRAGDGFRVPCFDAILAQSARLQALVDLPAIAWDWTVTADGPVLLEGNSGWSGLMPQVFRGGLLTGDRCGA
ncbi:hypothetical protein DSM112329_00812 [Paraconexibacter sp. AEG42_29]|uniref:Alpha-L-glutamate ligase-related protein ATP-grasp domain-containing protein n=1 Tax=Paraconexibacter sp. AEG42_29 TaxID=2997339 RepID=A0AAU7AR67_9ACTN